MSRWHTCSRADIDGTQDLRKEFAQTYSQAEKDEALSKTAKVVKKYSDEMIAKWNKEIDTLLVFVHDPLHQIAWSTHNQRGDRRVCSQLSSRHSTFNHTSSSNLLPQTPPLQCCSILLSRSIVSQSIHLVHLLIPPIPLAPSPPSRHPQFRHTPYSLTASGFPR